MCKSWEFQNCKNRPNRSTESEDSFTDNGFTSTAIAAIAAKIAGEKKNSQIFHVREGQCQKSYLRSPCSDFDDFYSFGILRTQGSF